MNKKNRPNKALCVAAALLCLCLMSAHFTTGLYARYTTRAEGHDAARVAKFNVAAVVEETAKTPADTTTDAALTRSYTATLTNSSEVAVRASLKMVFKDGVIVSSVGGGQAGQANKETVVLNGPYDLAPGGSQTITFTLTFSPDSVFEGTVTNHMDPTLESSAPYSAANEDLSAASYQLPFNAIVTFVQVD